MDRVIALVDMDCFYVQVAQRQQPHLKGKPCAVVQYKKWKGGGIIAVGYEARACGVTRSMRGDDAKAKCPEINLVHVPEVRGKADLTMFREAGAEVINVLCQFGGCVERASIDEAYIDMTEVVDSRLAQMAQANGLAAGLLPNTFIVGWEGDAEKDEEEQRSLGVEQWLQTLQSNDEDFLNDSSDALDSSSSSFPPELRLAMGAVIAEEMRAQVYADTGFRCSAGIAHNKMLAKLACGIHKPNRQTVLPQTGVNGLFKTLPIKKIRNLGGKFGVYLMEELGAENMGDIQQFSKKCLQQKFGDKDGTWVYELCRGYDYESVSDRNLAKSIGAGKNFPGREQLDTKEKVRYWLNQLCTEVAERLTKDREANGRVAKNIVVSVSNRGPRSFNTSKTCAIVRYDAEKLTEDTYQLVSKLNQAGPTQSSWIPPLHNLQVVANKFMDVSDSGNIKNFFSSNPSPSQLCSQLNTQISSSQDIKPTKKCDGIASFFKNAAKKSADNVPTKEMPVEWQDKENKEEICKSADLPSTSSEDSSVSKKLTSVVSEKAEKRKSFFQRYQERQQMRKSSPVVSPQKENVINECNGSNGDANQDKTCLENDGTEEFSNFENDTGGSSSTLATHNAEHSNTTSSSYGTGGGELEVISGNSIIEPQVTTVAIPGTSTAISSGVNGDSLVLNSKQDIDIIERPAVDMSGSDAGDYFPCERCHENVLVWHLEEHMDFHMACDLQKEDRQQRSAENYGVKQGSDHHSSLKPSSGTKRKSLTNDNNKSKKKISLEASKNSHKIDQFFKK